jgi:hypothetical protein
LVTVGLALLLLSAARGAPEQWTVVRTPNFSVLTAGAPQPAQAWAVDLERFRSGIALLMPAPAARLSPVVVMIFPSDRAFRPYRPLQNGKPVKAGGFFSRAGTINAIGLGVNSQQEQTRRIIFHEATHWFLSGRGKRIPMWLEEGIAEVFSTFWADEKTFAVGEVISNHVRYLREEGGVPPLRELAATARGQIDFHDSDRTGRFYAGSWLFVHWAIFGGRSPGAGSLDDYLRRLQSGEDLEAAFAGAFGGKPEAVDRVLAAYLATGKYSRPRFGLPAEPLRIEPPRPATEAEVEFARGSLLASARGGAQALPHLVRAAELDPGNPRHWEAIGFVKLDAADEASALAAFDRAANAGSLAAEVWCLRAHLQQRATPASAGAPAAVQRENVARWAGDFRRAIELDDQCQAAYQGLAELGAAIVPADAADAGRLREGHRLFPEDMTIAAGWAIARLRSGDRAGAEDDLRALLAKKEGLPARAGQMAREALARGEREKISREIERLAPEGRYGELVTLVDGALAEPLLGAENRSWLNGVKRELEQAQQLARVAAALNQGPDAGAVASLREMIDDPRTSAEIRREARRLLAKCAGDEKERKP